MSKLADIALDMEREAKRKGVAIRNLPRGLRMQLTWMDGEKALSMQRAAEPPGEVEVQICRSVFFVPPEAERTDTGRTVRFRWPASDTL